MAYAASLSLNSDTSAAVAAVTQEIRRGLGGQSPDLTLAFIGQKHSPKLRELLSALNHELPGGVLLACTSEAVAGVGTEVESGPSLSLFSATLPGAVLEPFHVQFESTPDGVVCDGLPEDEGRDPPPRAIFLLGDPFSCPIQKLLARLADDYPGVPVLGGMSSGGQQPRDLRLGWQAGPVQDGAVGVVVRGGPLIHTVVSQGCRPIGTPFVVTRAEQNILHDLGGRAALTRLEQVYSELSERDRLLIRDGLHVGIAIDEYRDHWQRGDFLISNVLSADKETGALMLGNNVRTGQTVQFHVRDAATADEDLKLLLAGLKDRGVQPAGGLLFSCNGRGTRLFARPHHDALAVQEAFGTIPLAGFFARGELGPIGRRSFIHGFTASLALFEDSAS